MRPLRITMANRYALVLLAVLCSNIESSVGDKKNGSCSLDAKDKNAFCSTLFSCAGHCGTPFDQDRSGGPFCSCDLMCKVFNDCCHDVDDVCQHANPHRLDSRVMRLQHEEKECFYNTYPVITTCNGRHGLQKRTLEPPVLDTNTGISFINEDVLICNLNDSKNIVSWRQVLHAQSGKNLLEVRSLVQSIVVGNLSTKFAPPVGSHPLHSRHCSINVAVASGECSQESYNSCERIDLETVNSLCSVHKNKISPGQTFNDSSGYSPNQNSSEQCTFLPVIADTEDLSTILIDHYEIRQIQTNGRVSSVYVGNVNVLQITNHWKEIKCNANIDTGHYYIVIEECDIVECEIGFFFSNEKCHVPIHLTVAFKAFSEIPHHDLSTVADLIRSNVLYNKDMKCQSLGNRIQRMGKNGTLSFVDHYSIVSISERDTRKELPVSLLVLEMCQILDPEITSKIISIQVCYFLKNGTSTPISRCDDIIKGDVISSDVQKYTLRGRRVSEPEINDRSDTFLSNCTDEMCVEVSSPPGELSSTANIGSVVSHTTPTPNDANTHYTSHDSLPLYLATIFILKNLPITPLN